MTLDKRLFRWLLWLWCRRAKRVYGGPGKRGEDFNSANFQSSVHITTGLLPDAETARRWLAVAGYYPGYGGCHWFRSKGQAEATWPDYDECVHPGCTKRRPDVPGPPDPYLQYVCIEHRDSGPYAPGGRAT